MKPLSLQDEEQIYEILKDIYNTSDCHNQDMIIQEMKNLCKDILEKWGDINI